MEIKLTWKWGETLPLCVAVGGEGIQVGALLWLDDSGRCRALTDFQASRTRDLTPGEEFAQRFLGVAMQSGGPVGNTIRVATAGTFEGSVDREATETLILGDCFGPEFNANGKPSGKLAPCSKAEAVGRICHTVNVPTGKALLRIKGRQTD